MTAIIDESGFDFGAGLARCPCCGHDVDPHAVLLDPTRHSVSYAGRTAHFAHMEFRIISELMKVYPSALSKDRLYDILYADRSDVDNMPVPKIIDVQICLARKKLVGIGIIITTIWGFGYGITLADPTLADAIKDAGIRARSPGSRRTWQVADDAILVDLVNRGFRLHQIAAVTHAPYIAIQRAMDRLKLDQSSVRRAA